MHAVVKINNNTFDLMHININIINYHVLHYKLLLIGST